MQSIIVQRNEVFNQSGEGTINLVDYINNYNSKHSLSNGSIYFSNFLSQYFIGGENLKGDRIWNIETIGQSYPIEQCRKIVIF